MKFVVYSSTILEQVTWVYILKPESLCNMTPCSLVKFYERLALTSSASHQPFLL